MPMQTYRLKVCAVPSTADGDIIHRTFTIRAMSLREAEYKSTVERCWDFWPNIFDWKAELI